MPRSGRDDARRSRPRSRRAAATSSMRMLSPTALSACTVDGQACGGADAEQLGEVDAEHEAEEEPDHRDHEEADDAEQDPDPQRGRPGAGDLETAAGDERTSRRRRRPGPRSPRAATVQAVAPADVDGPDQDRRPGSAAVPGRTGTTMPTRPTSDRQGDDQVGRGHGVDPVDTGTSGPHQTHRRPRTRGPGPSEGPWRSATSGVALGGGGRGVGRACGSRRGRRRRSHGACRRARGRGGRRRAAHRRDWSSTRR